MRIDSLWPCNFWFSWLIPCFDLWLMSCAIDQHFSSLSTVLALISCIYYNVPLNLQWLSNSCRFDQMINTWIWEIDQDLLSHVQHQSPVYYALPLISSISIQSTSFNSNLPCKFSFILSKSYIPHWLSVSFIIDKPQPQYISLVCPEHLRRPCQPLTILLLSCGNSSIDYQLVYGHTWWPIGLHKISLFLVLDLFDWVLPLVPSLPIHQFADPSIALCGLCESQPAFRVLFYNLCQTNQLSVLLQFS